MNHHLSRPSNGPRRPPNIEIISILENAGIQSDRPRRSNIIHQLHSDVCDALVSIILYTGNLSSFETYEKCKNIRERLRDWTTVATPTTPFPGARSQSPHLFLGIRFLYNPDRHHQILITPLMGTLLGLLCAVQSALTWLLEQPSYNLTSSQNYLPIPQDQIRELRFTMLQRSSDLERLRRESVRVLDIIDISGRWPEYLGCEYYALDEEGRTYRVPYQSLWESLVDMEGFVDGLYHMLPRLIEAISPARDEEHISTLVGWEAMVDENTSEEEEGDDGYVQDDESAADDFLRDGRETNGEEEEEEHAAPPMEMIVLEDVRRTLEEAGNQKMTGRVVLNGLPVVRRSNPDFVYTDPRRRFELAGPDASLTITLRARL